MSRLGFVVLALAVAAVWGQDDNCKFTGASGKQYDLTPMYKSDGEDYTKTIQVGPNIQFIYRINVCGNTVAKCQNQDAPATEALKIPAGETCRVLGRLDNAKYVEAPVEATDANPQGAGVAITYEEGDICDPTAKTTRSVTINVACDVNEEGTITEVKKEGTCATTFSLASKHACPATGGGHGTTILIIFASAFLIYAVVGTVMNMRAGKAGLEAFPHIEFWKDLPSLVMDGVKFTVHSFQDIRARFSGSSAHEDVGETF